jgi:hypothetical protein
MTSQSEIEIWDMIYVGYARQLADANIFLRFIPIQLDLKDLRYPCPPSMLNSATGSKTYAIRDC